MSNLHQKKEIRTEIGMIITRLIMRSCLTITLLAAFPVFGQNQNCTQLSDDFASSPDSMDSRSLMHLSLCVSAKLKRKAQSEGIITIDSGRIFAMTFDEVSSHEYTSKVPLLECVGFDEPGGVDPLLNSEDDKLSLSSVPYDGGSVEWLGGDIPDDAAYTAGQVGSVKEMAHSSVKTLKLYKIYEASLDNGMGRIYNIWDSE